MSVKLDTSVLAIVLNSYFENCLFIDGEVASTADFEVLKALPGTPNASKHPHLARWYTAMSHAERPKLPAQEESKEGGEDEEDTEMCDSDEDDSETERLRDQRIADYYMSVKQKKALPAEKSIVVLEVKPWDSDTDLDAMEAMIRGIEMDGLVWSKVAKRIPLGYGIERLDIYAVVENDKVSVEELVETIEGFEDYVQSVDKGAFVKL
ncbi:Translation elongation factor 1 beta [Coemansia sp. RSA 2706]|nr:Translation elongation factor 1 beta [Coemansia sp. RSA 2706]